MGIISECVLAKPDSLAQDLPYSYFNTLIYSAVESPEVLIWL